MFDATRPSRGYFPTLDGWRALSIGAVILCHDKIHEFGPFSTRWLYEHGAVGVDIFFAISGLLICARLLSEEQASGSISIRGFYIRRAFRILPPAILFLVTLEFLAKTIALPVGLPEVGAAILFVRNYTISFQHFQSIYPFYTSHFWSLAIEEHFYFILPALIVFVPRKWRVPSLLTLAVLVAVNRSLHTTAIRSFHTDMRLDALLVPASISILLQQKDFRERLISWLRLWPLLAVFLMGVISIGSLPRLETLSLAWLSPFLILGTMLRPHSLFGRFLELAPLRYIGRLSYSLYLWQQLFFVSHFGAISGKISTFQHWPLKLVMTLACSMFSYYFVERPLIRLGHRVASTSVVNRASHRGSSIEVH